MPSDELLPLFPLGVVLLPHNPLPLHIFEERYKEMIGLAIDEGSEFGVVLASEGGFASIGCTATVEEVIERYDDGRLDILALGRRRFQTVSVNQDRSFLQGKVNFFDDHDTASPLELRVEALKACSGLNPDDGPPADEESEALSFRLAGRIQDVQFRQGLLGTRTETARLRQIINWCSDNRERLEQAARTRAAAPLNGHGHLPKALRK